MSKLSAQLTIPTHQLRNTPVVSVATMRKIDQTMIEQFHVSITMMMEHAGRHVAVVTSLMLKHQIQDKSIIILTGKGNNGGDALAAARHLQNWGAKPTIILATPINQLNSHVLKQIKILKASNIPIQVFKKELNEKFHQQLKSSQAIIDGLIGYNLNGDPRPPFNLLIKAANQSKTPICAIDIPSGLNGDTGKPQQSTIKAITTTTLGLPKKAFEFKSAIDFTGTIYLADLSLPVKLLKQLNLNPAPHFNASGLTKLRV